MRFSDFSEDMAVAALRGGRSISWAIPYVAGACALAWQVNPDITASEMKDLLIDSAHVTKEKVRVIDPPALVELAKAR